VDPTLTALLRLIFELSQQGDQLRQRVAELEAQVVAQDEQLRRSQTDQDAVVPTPGG
jgi:hypothetical protein